MNADMTASVHPFDLAAVLLAVCRENPVAATSDAAVSCWLALPTKTREAALLSVLDELPAIAVPLCEAIKAGAEAQVERLRHQSDGGSW